MKKEFEVIQHTNMNYVEIFLVEIGNRNLHGHNDIEIGLVLDGTINANIAGQKTTLNKNDIFILNQYQIHSFTKTQENSLVLALQISNKLYNNYFYSLANTVFEQNIIRHSSDSSFVKNLLIELAYYYFSKVDYFELKCIGILHELLYFFMRTFPHHRVSDKENNSMRQNTHRLNRILDYIQNHYNEKISLSDIAEQEHLSIHYVSHFIKNILGVSLQEYLNNIRFEHAYQLLLNSDLTIMDICMETGFSNSRYLNNIFLSKYGCGVKEYRKNNLSAKHSTHELPINNIQTKLGTSQSFRIVSKLRQEEMPAYLNQLVFTTLF